MTKYINYITISLLFSAVSLHAQKTQLFDGHLALVEIDSAKPYDASKDDRIVAKSLPLIHQMTAKVVEIYDGNEKLKNVSFSMTPPPEFKGDPESLTHSKIGYDGIQMASKVNIGSRAILMLYHRKDIDHMNVSYNPYQFPDRSVFFTLLSRPGFHFNTSLPELFDKQKEWAEHIKKMNDIDEENNEARIAHLKEGMAHANPLISISSVHLLKRFYSETADGYFQEVLTAPETRFHTRLAIDHELCLKSKQVWLKDDKRKVLEEILIKEAGTMEEGEALLRFRKQMVTNESWFGRPLDMIGTQPDKK